MIFNLSHREKKLLAVLAVVVAVFFWYKSWGALWQRYQELQQTEKEYLVLEQELPELMQKADEQENILAVESGKLEILKNQFSPGNGFLVHLLSKLARDRVVVKEINPGESQQEPFYSIYTLTVAVEGEYNKVLDYIKLLESYSGLNISSLELKESEINSGSIDAELLLRYYQVQRATEQSIEPSTLYEARHSENPFTDNQVENYPLPENHEEEVSLNEGSFAGDPDSKDYSILIPYTFPVK